MLSNDHVDHNGNSRFLRKMIWLQDRVGEVGMRLNVRVVPCGIEYATVLTEH